MIHSQDARVAGMQPLADQALVPWTAAHYMFSLRMNVFKFLNNGGQWQTVGYLEHICKAVSRTAAAKLVVGDLRNALLHKCLAVALRAFTSANKNGVTAPVAELGPVQLVPTVVGPFVNQVAE